ncbi:WD40/YVTN/BNR-like repeat-containing protein [Aerococcus urinaeequi]|uniref:WD40/YVTN/BNR-like repeat-containing protein n=1 Tax=Aerococcus urinaeequi TaxID=51665 RepID=UPI00366B6AA0
MPLDNFRKINITLNKANQHVLEPQIAKVGDVNGRELVVQLIDGGVIKDQTGVTLKLNWQHANGNQGSETFSDLDAKKGVFSVYYPESMLYRGTVTANISINESGKITNSLNFQIAVKGDVFDGSAVEVDGILFTLKDLKDQLDERNDNIISLENRQISVENKFDSLQQEIANKDVISAPEIIEARNGEPTLSTRLEKDQQEVTAQLAKTPNPKNTVVSLVDGRVEESGGYNYWFTSGENTIYASFYGLSLRKSIDNGKTWTSLYEFPRRIVAVRELSNGELLVGIDYKNDVIGGEDYVSSNGQKNFTKVITHSMNSRLYNAWNVNTHDNQIIIGEYGNQGKAHKVWLSSDFGQTFSEIFDLSVHTNTPDKAHLHGVLWDKYWNRIWLTFGDGTIETENDMGAYYSDDLGETWTRMYIANQLLNMYALDDSVLFFTDSAPNGIYRYKRKSKNEQPTLDLVYTTDDEEVTITYLCTTLHQKNDKSPLIMGFKPTAGKTLKPFVLATYNGVDYFEMWKDDAAQTSNTDINVLQIGDDMVLYTTADSRYDYGSKITGKIVEKPNSITLTRSSTYVPFVDVRDLGLRGNGVDETREMINALQYVSGTNTTLIIPRNMTISVKDLTVNGLKDFNLLFQGTLKLVDLPVGGSGRVLEMVGCSNIKIYEVNVEGSGKIIQTLQKSVVLTNCSKVHIDELNATNPPSDVLEIEDSKDINVDYINAKGNNTGRDVVRIHSGENITINTIHSDGVGAINNHDVRGIYITPKSVSSVLKNISIGKIYHRSGAKAGLWIKNTYGAIVENIEIKSIEIVKTSSYTGYVNLTEDSYIMNVVGVKDFKLNGKVKEEKTSSFTGTALFINDVSDFEINLKAEKTNIAYIIGEKGITGGKFKGSANTIGFDVMRLAKATDVEFVVDFGEYSLGTADRFSIISYGTIKELTNVGFKRCNFKKPVNSTNNITLYQVIHNNVIIAYSDFSEWEGQPENKKVSSSNPIKKLYNIGLSEV